VLADEPTANLDHETAYRVIELMKKMRDEFGTTFIFSTHDPKIVGEAETSTPWKTARAERFRRQGGPGTMATCSKSPRNLLRYKRRTLLTASLITIGVVFVLVFVSMTGSFKAMMIAQNTDAMLGHLQVHRKGYVASIDNLPLNLNLKGNAITRLEKILDSQPRSPPTRRGSSSAPCSAPLSKTTNIRLNGIDPEKELATVPLLAGRVLEGGKTLEAGRNLAARSCLPRG
jgi:hypothetical protein